MNFWEELKKGTWVPYTVAVCAGVILYFVLSNLGMIGVFAGSVWKLASPLVIGVVIAYMIDPLARFFEKKGFKRKVSVVFAIAIIAAAAVILLVALIPKLTSGILQFLENVSSYIKALEQQIMTLDKSSGSQSVDANAVSSGIVEVLDSISKFFSSKSLLTASSGIGSGVTSFAMGFILAIYFLMDKAKLVTWVKRFFQKLLKEKRYNILAQFCSRCDRILTSYISCSLIEAVFVGVVNLLFMLVCRMPYASVISCIVGITNLAPTFGPIVGCVFGMFILLLTKPGAVVFFLIFTLILQTVDGYIVKPKLFGDTLGVSSLLILIFLILGGRLFGVWGILFAIPVAAILQYLFQEILFPNKKIGKTGTESEGRKRNTKTRTRIKFHNSGKQNSQILSVAEVKMGVEKSINAEKPEDEEKSTDA